MQLPDQNTCNSSDFWCCRPLEEFSNVPVGAFYLFEGIVYIVLYIPCLLAMAQEPLGSWSCYKIMLALGVIDVLEVCVVCVGDGLFSIFTITYCDHLGFMSWFNTADTWLWKIYMPLCMLLGFNRCVNLYSSALTEWLFGERRVWYWVGAISLSGTVYYAICMYTESYFIYHSGLGLQMFTPGGATELYAVLFDVGTSTALTVEYVALIVLLRRKARAASTETPLSSMEKRAIAQSFLICFFAVVTCYIYLPGLYLTRDPVFWRFIHVTTQWSHGSNVFIYLALNNTLRDKVLQMVGLKKAAVVSSKVVDFRMQPAAAQSNLETVRNAPQPTGPASIG